MAEGLRKLAALPKDTGSILSTHMAVHNCNSSSGDSSDTPICRLNPNVHKK